MDIASVVPVLGCVWQNGSDTFNKQGIIRDVMMDTGVLRSVSDKDCIWQAEFDSRMFVRFLVANPD